MNQEKFKEYIKSIGFEYNHNNNCFEYKELKINCWYNNYYIIYNLAVTIKTISYNDLTPLLKLTRRIKLDKILY